MSNKANIYLSKATKMLDRLSGRTARDWKTTAKTLGEHAKTHKVATPKRAERMAKVEAGRSFQTRAKVGVIGGAATVGGFLGLHKYHQHKDNQILKKIDKMYSEDWRNS